MIEEIANYIDFVREWFIRRVITPSSLPQLFIIAFFSIASQYISEKFKDKLRVFHEKYPYFTAKSPGLYKEGTFIFTFFVLLWGSVILARENSWDFDILEIAAHLVTAWGAIRVFSYPFDTSISLRLVVLFIWIVTVLNILGLFTATVDLLSKISIKLGLYEVGLYEVSLLSLLKLTLYLVSIVWLIKIISALVHNKLKNSRTLTPSQKVLFIKLLKLGLVCIAIIATLQYMGLDLRSLAFLGGALGLGIAFSLQKVFSNLISGLILLMDKSIKPGDVIAIGQTFGWVKRLNSRYVSLITRDGKEHLIPNELMISERVENWSFSDNNVRLHIPILISYQSDIHLARKLMLETIQDHARILKNPLPSCQLLKFQPDGVEFEIRAWIEDPVNGIGSITNDILTVVWDKFQESGIRFPYPQRDIHIKTSKKFLNELFKHIEHMSDPKKALESKSSNDGTIDDDDSENDEI